MDGRHLSLRKRLGLELYRRLHREAVERHELRTLFWECTLRCNLRCGHCGSDCTASPDCQDMPAEDFFRVLDRQITPRVDPHRVMVVLSGGEVLVRSDLERIGRALYDREYPWGMVTNGMALTPQRFDGLLGAGLHSMTVSIDGFEAEHNRLRRHPLSFARAAEAVRMAAAEPSIAFDAVTCVTPALVPRLDEFKEYLLSLGLRSWRLFAIFPAGRAAEDPALQLSDGQFRALMEFVRRTRREGRIACSYACEGFLGGYEMEARDHHYHCDAGAGLLCAGQYLPRRFLAGVDRAVRTLPPPRMDASGCVRRLRRVALLRGRPDAPARRRRRDDALLLPAAVPLSGRMVPYGYRRRLRNVCTGHEIGGGGKKVGGGTRLRFFRYICRRNEETFFEIRPVGDRRASAGRRLQRRGFH